MASTNLHRHLCCIIVILLNFQCAFSVSSYTFSTNEIWSKSGTTYRRPSWAGNVTIIYDEDEIRKVSGIVVPCSTTGRPSAPNPYNGFATGTDIQLDKGHLMALSNGGPDIKRNIVPQGSYWQEHGGWRILEQVTFDYAMAKYGWDSHNIPHASVVGNIADPGSDNYATWNLAIFDYDDSTGQPQRYTGTVSCGKETYSFTISPEDDAVWDSKGTPPSNATHVTSRDLTVNEKMSTDSVDDAGEKSTADIVGIVFLVGILVVLIFVAGATLYLYCRNKEQKKRVMNAAEYTPYQQL